MLGIAIQQLVSLEKEMATHSSILAWKILWTEEPGGLHTVHGVTRVGHHVVTEPTKPTGDSRREGKAENGKRRENNGQKEKRGKGEARLKRI